MKEKKNILLITSDQQHWFTLGQLNPEIKTPYLVPEPWASMYDPDTLTVPEGFAGEHANTPPHFGLTQEEQPDFSPWREREGSAMTGLDQTAVWSGAVDSARDHVIVENRHQPTTIHQRCYVNGRYKITVYYNQPYGELFDLQADPDEQNNLWDTPAAQELKKELLLKLIHAELGKEPIWMPRVCGA